NASVHKQEWNITLYRSRFEKNRHCHRPRNKTGSQRFFSGCRRLRRWKERRCTSEVSYQELYFVTIMLVYFQHLIPFN
ncbi:unnamed protein product, partial [Callosobruchus maculatus]